MIYLRIVLAYLLIGSMFLSFDFLELPRTWPEIVTWELLWPVILGGAAYIKLKRRFTKK